MSAIQDPAIAEAASVSDARPVVRKRLDSVDLLRGVVMAVMALDHTRDFFHHDAPIFDPLDLTKTNAAVFLTRWITHFCAPTFVFLAGTGAYLSLTRGKSKAEQSRFLLTRGLWLIVLELTFIRCLGWYLDFNYQESHAGVIWAIGWSMIALAGLIHLPRRAVVVFSVVMIAGHNALDGVSPESLRSWGWLWAILHVPTTLQLRPNMHFFTQYPLVPWIGVMAAGYSFGALLEREPHARRKILLRLGLAITIGFVLLRAVNLYGDPHRWSKQASVLLTIFSFINCEKYPPSLLFLMMTLGPALMALAVCSRISGKLARPLITFGRVPLFYYLLHLPLLRVGMMIAAFIRYGPAIISMPKDQPPPNWGYSLPIVYLLWLTALLLLYFPCRWFAGVKQRRRDAWLSYL